MYSISIFISCLPPIGSTGGGQSGGGIDAVERAVGIAAIQRAVLADSAALVVRVSHIQSLISIRDEVQDYPIVELRFLYRFLSNGCADENRQMDAF